MTSVSMMASFVGGVAAVRPMNSHRTLVVAKAAARAEGQDVAAANFNCKEERESNGRRAAMFAMAAAAVTAVAGTGQGMMAFAEEPKRGTPEAKKKYAAVCVSMPTARICHKIA